MPSQIDPVPGHLHAVVELFATTLAGVSFPDVDSQSLAAMAERVRAQAEEVARAEAALERARAQLDAERDQLAQAASRGLAYARIYADAHPELALDLDGLARPAASSAGDPPTRRPRKKTPRPELPFAPEVASASDAPAP